MSAGRVLVVDDDRAFRRSTAVLLEQDGHEVVAVENAQKAVDTLRARRFDLVLLDLRMPGLDGIGLAEALRVWGERVPILMISGFGTVDLAVQALHTGVDDFLTKPVEPDVLTARVQALLERRPAANGGDAPGEMVGRSAAMRAVYDRVRRVAPTDTTVLITGETGTGKELVARAVHAGSERADEPFLAVNCASLPEGLLESELFGHVRGAFTGAVRDKRGLFEAADGGTLFLDEIGDVSAALQHRLLRVLQEREFLPVGAVEPVEVDVRIVAATNRDLRADVDDGRFREDLFYRLNVYRIDLPPLRERRSDIPLLVESFLNRRRDPDGPAERLTCSPLAMRTLQAYRWPGNVRELFAALESALIQADGPRIEAQHLPPEVRSAVGGRSAPTATERYSAADVDDERAAIEAALEQADGVKTRAAEILGMGRTTLWRKMRKYGMDVGDDDG